VIRPDTSRAVPADEPVAIPIRFRRGFSYEIQGGYGWYISAMQVQDEYFRIGRVRADAVSWQTAICAHLAVMSQILNRARSAEEQRSAVRASRDNFKLAIEHWHQHADQAKVRVYECMAGFLLSDAQHGDTVQGARHDCRRPPATSDDLICTLPHPPFDSRGVSRRGFQPGPSPLVLPPCLILEFKQP
jgi:hypothetical protein